MWPVRIFISLLLLVISSSFAQDAEPPCKGACQIRFRCSNEENVVWATNNKSCFVFLNECHLKTANCQRQDNCKKDLVKVSKTKCQKLCQSVCPALYSPVCAEYNGAKKEFSNDCERKAYICESGKVWDLFSHSAC